MEQIADASEVGLSTLYRYFSTKDELALAPISATVGRLATNLRARPADEDLETALGNALRAALLEFDSEAEQINELMDIVDKTSRPRAQLWDVWNQDLALLIEAIAERTGADPTEPWVSITAHVTKLVAGMATDKSRVDPTHSSTVETAQSILTFLGSAIVIPRLTGSTSSTYRVSDMSGSRTAVPPTGAH